MDEIEKAKIIKALDNDKNQSLIELDNSRIKTIKNDILQQLPLNRDERKNFHEKLKNYRYVDNEHETKLGGYIRWINLKKKEKISLTNGGIIIKAKKISDNIHLVVKNNINRILQINMECCLIFQKISDQENIILSVNDYLNKENS